MTSAEKVNIGICRGPQAEQRSFTQVAYYVVAKQVFLLNVKRALRHSTEA